MKPLHRFLRILFVLVLSFLFLVACGGDETPTLEEVKALPGVSVDVNGNITMPEKEGILSQLQIEQTCSSTIDWKSLSVPERFENFENCDGSSKIITFDDKHTLISIHSSLLNVMLDDSLVVDLIHGLSVAGLGNDLPHVAVSFVVIHPEDGSDGLPGGNLISFTAQSQTYAEANVSATFTSIPVSGDNVSDLEALGTQLCHTQLIAEEDAVKAERECNSFGSAVSTAWLGWSYDDYVTLMSASNFYLDGQVISFEAISEEAYDYLLTALADEVDMFER